MLGVLGEYNTGNLRLPLTRCKERKPSMVTKIQIGSFLQLFSARQ